MVDALRLVASDFFWEGAGFCRVYSRILEGYMGPSKIGCEWKMTWRRTWKTTMYKVDL